MTGSTTPPDAPPIPGDHVYVEWLDAETGEPYRAVSGVFRLDTRGGAVVAGDGVNPDYPTHIDDKCRVTVRKRASVREAAVEAVALALASHAELGGGMTDSPAWYVSSGAAARALDAVPSRPAPIEIRADRMTLHHTPFPAGWDSMVDLLRTAGVLSPGGGPVSSDVIAAAVRVMAREHAGLADVLGVPAGWTGARGAPSALPDAARRLRARAERGDGTEALRRVLTAIGVQPRPAAEGRILEQDLIRVLRVRHARLCAALGVPESTPHGALTARARTLRDAVSDTDLRELVDDYRDTLAGVLELAGPPSWRGIADRVREMVEELDRLKAAGPGPGDAGAPGPLPGGDNETPGGTAQPTATRLCCDPPCDECTGMEPDPGTPGELESALRDVLHSHAPALARGLAATVRVRLRHADERTARLRSDLDETGRRLRLALDTVRTDVARGLGVPVEQVAAHDLDARVRELVTLARSVREREDRSQVLQTRLRELEYAHDELVEEVSELVGVHPAEVADRDWSSLLRDWRAVHDGERLAVQRVWRHDPASVPDNPQVPVVCTNGVLWRWDPAREEYVAWYAPGGTRTWAALLEWSGTLVEAVDWFRPPVGWGNRVDEVLHFHGLRDESYRDVSFALGNLIRSWIGSWAHDTDHAPGGPHWGPRTPAAQALEVSEIELPERFRPHRTYAVPGRSNGVAVVEVRCHDCGEVRRAVGPSTAEMLRRTHEREAEPVLVDSSAPQTFTVRDREPHETITRVRVSDGRLFDRVAVGIGGLPVDERGSGRVRLGWRWRTGGSGPLLRWRALIERHGTAVEVFAGHRVSVSPSGDRARAVCLEDDCRWTVAGAMNRVAREAAAHGGTVVVS